MTGLDGKAHRLIELARTGDDPTAAQLASLHGAVAARIAADAALAASGSAASGKAASGGALIKGIVVAAAVATGGAGFFALRGSDPVAPPMPVAAVAAPRVQPSPPAASPPEPVLSAPSAEAVAPPVRAPKPAAGLRLEEEAALLAEVQGALRSGQARSALGKLETYDRRFPSGVLRAEADAARVFALCAAGRVDKARASAARFVQRYPGSPAAARVQAACR